MLFFSHYKNNGENDAFKRGAAYPMRMKGDEEWNRTLRVE